MPIKICGEVMLRVHQHLLSQDRMRLEDDQAWSIHTAQSLAQCHEWLSQQPAGRRRACAVASNGEAARMAG
jgi:chorismate mutase/prephenate dehydratase